MKHFPCGINPSKSCGFDRLPYAPIEGESVVIRCVTEKGETAPILNLYTESRNEQITGTPDTQIAENCWAFSVGAFQAFEKVNYSFSNEPKKTYSFIVEKLLNIKECYGLFLNEEFLAASCKLSDDTLISLRFSLKNDGIAVSTIQNDKENGSKTQQACIQTKQGIEIIATASPFTITIKNAKNEILLTFAGNQFGFQKDEKGHISKFAYRFSAVGNGFYGFGEKFDRVNQKGLCPTNLVYEHFTHQGSNTYLPTPWLFTEQGWGLYCETDCRVNFDLSNKQDDRTLVKLEGETGSSNVPNLQFLFGSPSELLHGFQKLTGKCELPPDWAFGPWISANDWDKQITAEEQVKKLKELDIPATVMVLEAWSDETTFYIMNGAKYNPQSGTPLSYHDFTFEKDGLWNNPKGFSQLLEENELHLVLWQIPIIKNASENDCEQLTIDEKEAIENHYCVMNEDGTPYRIPDRWFAGSLLLDFTNPDAVKWWFEKRRYLRDELHVDGFKTDGGEFVYDLNSKFFNGKTGADMRNQYAAAYTQAYYDFMQQGERKGIIFSRAGYTGSQKRPMHWAGDQCSTFEEMQSQLKAGLSAGLSGIPFWGFDIAGFAGDLPTTDLYLRATEMAAFSPVMQFHSEPSTGQFGDNNRRSLINDRSPWNMAEVNEEPQIIEVYRKYAQLRMKLLPYICKEAKVCVDTGRPMLTHLIFDYPNDENVIDIEDEYLFGRDLLVAPIMQENQRERRGYLPFGDWYDFWTGEKISGGKWIKVNAPLDFIPVFSKKSDFVFSNLKQA